MTTFSDADLETARRHRKAKFVRELLALEKRLPRAIKFHVTYPSLEGAEQNHVSLALDAEELAALKTFVADMIRTKVDAQLLAEGWERDPG